MIFWITISVSYLLLGFCFSKPDEWNKTQKVLSHIFWLPLAAIIYSVLFMGLWQNKRR
ncbi:hypothetical protein AB0Y20_01050 [Heyndrickxia oleronia]